jgi:exodeoxyribonuclease-1
LAASDGSAVLLRFYRAVAVSKTFYWHDYETWGADPRRDRACQFAGLRTDEDLKPVGEPLVLFCRPADDLLPQPDACLVTGISPGRALRDGVPETDFANAVERELARPGTCGAGYNSIRFDDEVTRNLFYRNFLDPYAREWQNGNSRWDLIDTARLAHALRPEGIQWPTRDDGTASFKLELLTAANGIEHSGAHDALSDVRATIALARLLKTSQPRLFDYALTLRDKHRVKVLLDKGVPLLHASARYPAELGCIAPILPVARHPANKNGVVCFDLRKDPEPLLSGSVDEIHMRLFTRAEDLPEGVERIPLKTVHLNRSPVLAPMATLTPETAERWGIDRPVVERHAAALRAAAELSKKVQQVHQMAEREPEHDPDLMIYSGGFFPDGDRREMTRLRGLGPGELADAAFVFEDPRLEQMLFRYRARNWPDSLSEDEREEWDAYRLRRLTDPEGGASVVLDDYQQRIDQLRRENVGAGARLALLDDLEAWAERVMDAGS